MKWLILYAIGISSLTTYAQEPKICFTSEEVRKIADELIAKDGLVYILDKKDSIISVYAIGASQDSVAIRAYKLSAEEYKTAYELSELNRLQEKEVYSKQLDKEKGKRIGAFIKGGLIVGALVWLTDKLADR